MTATVLSVGGVDVATYENGQGMPRQLSPRPHLHPVRTLSGVEVTETHADDHAHHYGVSMALPDVDGTSYWGGRTFVSGSGSTLLENHGREVSTSLRQTPGDVGETLDYLDENGRLQLTETRRLDARPSASGWILGWRSVLTVPAAGVGVSLGSPATNGREGAFYGGIFWRLPFREATALSAGGAGADLAHGSVSPWLALTTDTGTLVATNPEGLPWFVRTEGYVGFGPAVAHSTRRLIAGGGSLELGLDVLVSDRASVTLDEALTLAEELRS